MSDHIQGQKCKDSPAYSIGTMHLRDGLYETPSLIGSAHHIFFKILQVDIKNDTSRLLRY